MLIKRYSCLICGALLCLSACAPDIDKFSDPASPSAGMIKMAEQMVSRGDNAAAADFYRQAIQNDPKSSVARKGFGNLLEKSGNQVEAAVQYQAALKSVPEDSELLRRYGRVLIALDRPSEAKEQYEMALEQDSKDIKALNGLGVALDYLSEHEKAQEKYKKALGYEPKGISTINNLAYSYIISGKYSEAVSLFEPYQKAPESTPALRQNLALAYGMSGMDMDAERVAKMDLPLSQVRANMAYYQKKRSELALTVEPYAELGSYSTQGIAEIQAEKIKAMGLGKKAMVSCVPELNAPGGTPRFTVRLSVGHDAAELEMICKDLVKRDVSCVVKRPK